MPPGSLREVPQVASRSLSHRHWFTTQALLLEDLRVETFYVTLHPRTSPGPLNAKKSTFLQGLNFLGQQLVSTTIAPQGRIQDKRRRRGALIACKKRGWNLSVVDGEGRW